jgi:uncharacterized protein
VIAFVAGLLRFLFLLFIVRMVLRGFHALTAPAPAPATRSQKTAVDLVRDRICNTFLPRSRAVRAIIAGEEQLFCSSECADRARTV